MDEAAGLRDRLVEAAVAALRAGEGDVSLRQLAKGAGVSAMAPYRHFSDKAALLAAVAEHGFDLLRQAVAGADAAPGTDADKLVAQGLAYVGFARSEPALFRQMFGAAEACAADEERRGAAYQVLAKRVGLLTRNAAPLAPLSCWALVHGLATLAIDRGLPLAEEQVRGVVELFVDGLAKGAMAPAGDS